MTKGIYEGCVGDYMKVTIWCGGFFWCRKLTFFYCWARFSLASSTGFSPNARFGRKGRAVQTWCAISKMKGGEGGIIGKIGNTKGIIEGDNSAGHCFVLRVLILMNFFKWDVVYNQGRDGVRGRHDGKGEDSIFWWVGSEPSQSLR